MTWYGQALEGARRDGDRRAEAQALNGLGQSHRLAGRFAEAAPFFERALEVREAIGHRRGAALTRLCLGDLALASGRYGEAVEPLTAARAGLLAAASDYDAARALAFLGRAVALSRGDYVTAESQLRQALAEFESAGSAHWQGRVLEMLGETAQERGHTARARDWYERSLARYAPVSRTDATRLEDRLRELG
ncbi:tetratricopeptide repeat protein [Streptomyces sp. M19]